MFYHRYVKNMMVYLLTYKLLKKYAALSNFLSQYERAIFQRVTDISVTSMYSGTSKKTVKSIEKD